MICPRCGCRSWWRHQYRGEWRSCTACGYVPERVHTERRREAELRAEAEQTRAPAVVLTPKPPIHAALDRYEQAVREDEQAAGNRALVPCPVQATTEVECGDNCRICQGAGEVPRVVAEVRSNPKAMASIRRGIADREAVPLSALERKRDIPLSVEPDDLPLQGDE